MTKENLSDDINFRNCTARKTSNEILLWNFNRYFRPLLKYYEKKTMQGEYMVGLHGRSIIWPLTLRQESKSWNAIKRIFLRKFVLPVSELEFFEMKSSIDDCY